MVGDSAVSDSNRAGLGSPETPDDTVQLAGGSEDDDVIMEAASRIATEVRGNRSLILLSLRLTSSLVGESTIARSLKEGHKCSTSAG